MPHDYRYDHMLENPNRYESCDNVGPENDDPEATRSSRYHRCSRPKGHDQTPNNDPVHHCGHGLTW